jgi:predicted metal-dependent hydrolase
MNPYEELANAIVLSAAKDYRKALKRLQRFPRDSNARQVKKECERFFRSGWFATLTSLDGTVLMEKLKAEVA